MKKKTVCETVVWSLADWVKNLIEKKWPGLSYSDMVTGGLETEMKDNVGDSDPESFQLYVEGQVFENFLYQESAPNGYILVRFETEKPVYYVAQIMVVHEEEYHVSFTRKTIGKIVGVLCCTDYGIVMGRLFMN